MSLIINSASESANSATAATVNSDSDKRENHNNNSNEISSEKSSDGGGGSSSKKELIAYTIIVIIICLTTFNLYIFYWTLSSLNGIGKSILHSNSWAKVKLFHNNDIIKFNGKLRSKETFQVDYLRSKLNGKLILNVMNKSIELNYFENKLLELNSFERNINFPNGIRIRGLNRRIEHDEDVLVCSPLSINFLSKGSGKCLIKNISKIILNSEKGVDFLQKSLNTNKILTKRLHSPTNSLLLLSNKTSSFKTNQGSIDITSLDGITLNSRNSFVIIDSKAINISNVSGLKYSLTQRIDSNNNNNNNNNNGYKLCICMKENDNKLLFKFNENKIEELKTIEEKFNFNENKNLGLLFAIKNNLDCLKFSSFCNSPN